jgi:ribosomal protein S18 acetylase RimI-like enzyme
MRDDTPVPYDPALFATSVSRNLAALFGAMTDLPGSERDVRAGMVRHLAFPTNPMFKGVSATDLKPEAVDRAIVETVDWFRSRGAPFFFWWTGPETRPADLGDRLRAHGLLSMEEQQQVLAPGIVQAASGAPVMVMDLDSADFTPAEHLPAGFSLRQVTDAEGLAAFKKVFCATYVIPDWAGQAWVDATLAFGANAPWRIFVGELDGRPVATNILFNGGGVASVYGVAVLPEVQGRGLGGAVTLAPLRLARAEGYRLACLFSSEKGIAVYRRLGFADTGARIDRYMWRA